MLIYHEMQITLLKRQIPTSFCYYILNYLSLDPKDHSRKNRMMKASVNKLIFFAASFKLPTFPIKHFTVIFTTKENHAKLVSYYNNICIKALHSIRLNDLITCVKTGYCLYLRSKNEQILFRQNPTFHRQLQS